MNPRTSDDEVSYGETSSSSPSSSDDERSKIDDGGGDHDDTRRSTRVDDTADRKSDYATADTRYKDDNSNPFSKHEILQSKSSSPSPAPLTDEKGWSTGVDSSSKSHGDSSLDQDNKEEHEHEPQSRSFSFEEESNEEIHLGNPKLSEKDDQDNKLRDEWGFTSMGAYEKQIDDDISYDDIEDGSSWVSDAEKVTASGGTDGNTSDDDDDDHYSRILPTVDEKFSEEEFAIWPSEIPPSSENDVDSVSQDENIAARSENNSFRDIIDEESRFNDSFQASDYVEPLRAKKQQMDDVPGIESNVVTSASTMIPSHRAFSAAHDSSKPTSQKILFSSDPMSNVASNKSKPSKRNVPVSESTLFTSASSYRFSNVTHESSKSTSKDRSGSGSKVSSSSSSWSSSSWSSSSWSSSSSSSMLSFDRKRDVAHDSSKSTSKHRSSSSESKVLSSSMFSPDQTSGVAQDSSKSKARDISGSAENILSLSTMASSHSSKSTDQNSFGSEHRELNSYTATSSSNHLASAKITSTSSISSPFIEKSPNTTNDIEEYPTVALSSNALDNMDRTFAEEGSKFRRRPGDPSTLDGAYASFDSSENILEENVGSSNVKSKKSTNQLRARDSEQKNYEELMSVVSDSKSLAKNNNNYQSSKTENMNLDINSKRSESKSMSRRHRQPRGSRKSSRYTVSSSAQPSSIRSRVSANESNSNNSEASEAQIPRTQSNTPISRPAHSSPRNESKTKQRARKPGSDRNNLSRKLTSYQSKPVERSSYRSGGSKTAKGKFENKIGASPNTEVNNFTSNFIRSRKQVHAKKKDLQKPLSDIQVERYRGAENSFNQKDLAPNALYFSKSVSFLKDYDCGLKTKTKRIHATINNEGYKTLVRKAYYKLLELRPRLKYLLSLSEWLHVHMLLLYARIFDCELHFYSIVLPRGFQIAVPNNVMVFEPIAAVISSIGIVEEVDMGVTYIPVARSYRGSDVYKPHDKDDVTEFLEWTQYDWNSSWYQVEKARLERRKMAAEKNMKIPKSEAQLDDAKLEEWQQLAVEKWLGWDEDLWFSYNQACYVLGRTGRFVSIRRDSSKHGSYAWLLPRHTNDTGTFVRVPRPNLSPDSWMIAVMLHMCALEPPTTATWYYETNSIDNVQYLIDCFLGAAITATQSIDTATSL
jgi:hypothetical protein